MAEWQHGIVAGQPAPWQAEVDRAAEAERRQVQNIVIQPPLAFGGHIYTVMYQAAGQYRRSDANLFFDTAADTLTRKNILGLTVWRDDVLVTDEEELRTVFTLYTAAYLLYERPPGSSLGSIPPDIRDDLQKITRNPLLPEQQTKELFKSRQDRIQDAMRGILTPQVPPAEVEQLASDIRRNVEQGKTVIDAFDKTVETMRFSNNHSIRQLRVAIREAFKDWQPVIEQGTSYVDIGAGRRLELFNALDVIDVGTRLLWMADFNQERANWLKGYQQATIDQEEARLDDEQMVAVDIVRSEVQSSSAQRANIILDFVRDKTVDLTWKLGIEELTRRWVAWSWQTFGKRIVGHLVAGAATTVELALRLGDLLYGLDDLYDNFQVAVQADELRVRFQAGRLALQRQARDEDKMIYNGELAEAFRYAYLLEMLAGAQTQRGYADGVAATVRQENWLAQLNPLNWIKGAEWREATEGLHKLANQDEQKAEADLGHPASVDAAVVLALQTAHTEVPHSVPTRIPTPTATPPPYAKLEPTVAALHATVQALQTQVAVLSNALAQAPAQRDGTPVPGHAATLIGKWELQHGGGDCLGMFEPTSIEFFDDGTYVATVSSMWILSPQMGGHYMLLEEKRVRFEVPQMGFEICELNLSGDVFTLAGSAGKVNRYVRYREASTTTYRQAITGQWERAGYSENECFEPFGGNPNELIMMPDEMFVARGTNKNWYGQYFVVGSSVQFAQSMAQPKVTWTPAPSAKFSEMQMLFDVLAILSGSGMSSSDSPPEPFEGTTTCEIRRITEMQLILVDSKGNQTVFRRSKTEEELLQTLKDTATDQIVPTPSR
ncbi:MAG: hypothetical protein BWY63_02591 [Chloroflexi bacterium ADurb.Bin360]|nr:MAG: hypothetical protein BWY63_02591 [Chloroflexi bacterium ADurb.Bin360]